jgi:hypothetical protein
VIQPEAAWQEHQQFGFVSYKSYEFLCLDGGKNDDTGLHLFVLSSPFVDPGIFRGIDVTN